MSITWEKVGDAVVAGINKALDDGDAGLDGPIGEPAATILRTMEVTTEEIFTLRFFGVTHTVEIWIDGNGDLGIELSPERHAALVDIPGRKKI
jgi:hypothetical protein